MKAKPYTTFKNPFEMSRYIDLDKIPFVVGFDAETGEEIRLVTKKQLDELPTADVVEVVRCKDCRYKDECTQYVLICGDEGELAFCSYGERREECKQEK